MFAAGVDTTDMARWPSRRIEISEIENLEVTGMSAIHRPESEGRLLTGDDNGLHWADAVTRFILSNDDRTRSASALVTWMLDENLPERLYNTLPSPSPCPSSGPCRTAQL